MLLLKYSCVGYVSLVSAKVLDYVYHLSPHLHSFCHWYPCQGFDSLLLSISCAACFQIIYAGVVSPSVVLVFVAPSITRPSMKGIYLNAVFKYKIVSILKRQSFATCFFTILCLSGITHCFTCCQ